MFDIRPIWNSSFKEGFSKALHRERVAMIPEFFGLKTAQCLAEEVHRLEYRKLPELFGPRQVPQEVSSADVPERCMLRHFANAVIREVTQALGPDVLDRRYQFNSFAVQRYEDGIGRIEPHRDGKSFKNLILLATLSGQGTFRVYQDVEGPETMQFIAGPGSLILMVAPGYLQEGDMFQPCHSVGNIVGRRYVLALRQYYRG